MPAYGVPISGLMTEAFNFVLQPEFFFFEFGNLDFVKSGVLHFLRYVGFELCVLAGQFINMRLDCHIFLHVIANLAIITQNRPI